MSTENLQEMIAGANTEPASGKMSEYDILLGHTKKNMGLPAAEQKELAPGQELQVIEPEPDREPPDNYQPATEASLINYINALNVKLGEVTIVTHWQIGQTINAFYRGKYGTNELGKISEATGIGRDTLAKACKFAKQYTKENVEMLVKGNFVMSWYQITKHLTVAPEKVMETYQQSPDPNQFYNGIIKLKNPVETRGKSKQSKVIEGKSIEPPIYVTPEIKPTGIFTQKFVEFEAPGDISQNAVEHYNQYLRELETLTRENERLKYELLSRDSQIGDLQAVLAAVKREKEKYENSFYEYMDKLDKVRTGLESNTPARAIIDWMDNGGDE